MSIFKDKVLMITGGTGSFGNAVLRRFLTSDIGEILELLGKEETLKRIDAGVKTLG